MTPEEIRKDERAKVNAEWLDRARRYFEGIRDPEKMLKGWAAGSVHADVVMHEVWKRDPKVSAALSDSRRKGMEEAARLVCGRCEADWPRQESEPGYWIHNLKNTPTTCAAAAIWRRLMAEGEGK